MPDGWTLVQSASSAPSADGWTMVQPAAGSQSQPEAPAGRSWIDSVGDYLGEALSSLKPSNINAGIQQAFWHPIDTVNAIGNAQGALLTKAEDAFKQGDYARGVRHAIDYLLPVIGPRLDQAADYAVQGDFAKSLGATTDVALQTMGPEVAARALAAVPKVLKAPLPVQPPQMTDALAFAQREGIPLDAATATGSDLVRSIQKKVSDSMGGAGTAERFKAAQADRLATVGEQLAAKGYPAAPVTPEMAGTGVQDAIASKIADLGSRADAAYTKAEQLAAQNTKTVQTGTKSIDTGILDAAGRPVMRTEPVAQTFESPIDVAAAKAGLSSLYTDLKRQSELVPLQGAKARALVALDRFMNGPDTVSLMTAERASSDLGALAGHPDLPELRTAGQGAAAKAFGALRQQIDAAAQAIGPDVYQALADGRNATKAKYSLADVYDKIRDEPVKAFDRTVSPRDSAIEHLRVIKEHAPEELPKIGRAYLDGLVDRATADGGFQHAAAVKAAWGRLGPETKYALFPQPGHVADIDSFFRLAAKIAENPNPSGTARINNLFNVASAAIGYPVAKLMYSPTGVKLLTEGMRLPPSDVARSAWIARVKALARTAQGAAAVAPSVAAAPAR